MIGIRSLKCSMARMARQDSGRPSVPGGMPASSRSRPEQKPAPAPVRITTQVSWSRPPPGGVAQRRDRVERHGVHALGPVERELAHVGRGSDTSR